MSRYAETVAEMSVEQRNELLGALLTQALIGATAGQVEEALQRMQPPRPLVDDAGEPWPAVMKVGPAAQYAGTSTKHLYDLANAGRLGFRRTESDHAPWFFRREDLDRLVREEQEEHRARHRELMAPGRGRRARRAS